MGTVSDYENSALLHRGSQVQVVDNLGLVRNHIGSRVAAVHRCPSSILPDHMAEGARAVQLQNFATDDSSRLRQCNELQRQWQAEFAWLGFLREPGSSRGEASSSSLPWTQNSMVPG